jgi:uncharacterized protein DUF998
MSAPVIATIPPTAPPGPLRRSRTPWVSALLVCGLLAPALYLGMIWLIRYEGYNPMSQVPSELTAIGAPTRELWAWLGGLYAALAFAFGWGLWKSAGTNRSLRRVGALILVSIVLAFLWPFAPMHQRDVLAAGGGTFGDILHQILGVVTVILFLLTVGFGSAAFGRRFRSYSIATIVIAIVFGVLLGLEAPRLSANLPTPWIGLWERLNISAYMLWLAVLAIAVLRTPREHAP